MLKSEVDYKLQDKDTRQTQALALALNYSGLSESDLLNQSLVTHFSPNYDFRNKRLPVWQFEFNDADHRIIYIDSISGILVDQSRTQDRIERWSFSLLHKWNMLTPLIGREIRDVLVVITLSLLLLSAMFGAIMLYRAQSGNKFRVK